MKTKKMLVAVSPITLSAITMAKNTIIRLLMKNLRRKYQASIIILGVRFITDLDRQMLGILSKGLFLGWSVMMLRNLSIKTLFTLNKITWAAFHKGMRLGVVRVALNSLNLALKTPVCLELTSTSI
jgi:hypothetical protein